MAFATIPAWSTTAGTNTEIDGISLAENVMVPSAVNNAFREMMSQIAEFTRRGSDLASASTLDLDSIDTMFLDITGSTTVSAVTLTDGHSRRARATGAFQLTASATLVVNGSTTSNYTTTAGDLLFFEGYGASTVRVWSMGQTTAATPSAAGIVKLEPVVCDGRLTLTTGVPVTTADVTAAGTLYFTPYNGNHIGLYASSAWSVVNFTEVSLSLTLTSGKPYDIFGYSNAGVLTLESLVWTNDTTRATALTTQDGIYVKSGDATRRYLGTIYASGANTTEDSAAKRYVWNAYNRVARRLYRVDGTDTWNYSTATWRQANGSTSNQVEWITGLESDNVNVEVQAQVSNDTTTVRYGRVALGVDSTSVPSGILAVLTVGLSASLVACGRATYNGYPGVGRHYAAWLERGHGSDTQTWYGDSGDATLTQTGMFGRVMA